MLAGDSNISTKTTQITTVSSDKVLRSVLAKGAGKLLAPSDAGFEAYTRLEKNLQSFAGKYPLPDGSTLDVTDFIKTNILPKLEFSDPETAARYWSGAEALYQVALADPAFIAWVDYANSAQAAKEKQRVEEGAWDALTLSTLLPHLQEEYDKQFNQEVNPTLSQPSHKMLVDSGWQLAGLTFVFCVFLLLLQTFALLRMSQKMGRQDPPV